MASELPPEQRASYSAIIDGILASANLDTISAKAIRKGLQAKVDHDLSDQKDAITKLIMDRFDKVQRERESGGADEPAPTANGFDHSDQSSAEPTNGAAHDDSEATPPSHKRKAEEEEEEDESDELSDVKDTPPPKKVKKSAPKATKKGPETDEEIARRLQEEYSRAGARSTRGGGTASATKKKAAAKPVKKTKKKSATKVNSDDDSAVDSGSDKPDKPKTGGFHKLMHLSEPLQALLGEQTLSRPQTVKKIWAYVKERDLQDPSDKRQIRCDDPLRAVFKTEKIHMFTMNKVLATQLWPVEEVAAA